VKVGPPLQLFYFSFWDAKSNTALNPGIARELGFGGEWLIYNLRELIE
jgi:hypothetical protein